VVGTALALISEHRDNWSGVVRLLGGLPDYFFGELFLRLPFSDYAEMMIFAATITGSVVGAAAVELEGGRNHNNT
jgi:hypothetical protein